ncbi:hypothetical protein DFH09DRAFT_1187235 [Mycena vulgaris]|nr:hypothetical protein DFH09DRAFT_1187235 [Mycena vulgaris]
MVSPFASKLGTNYCPLDEEIREIQGLIFQSSSRLQRLDDQLADLQKAIERLTKERDSLSNYVEAHKSLISPARRLPLDIIQEIFVACIPTHRNCVMSAREAPVLLGRICSSWRTISLSTPRLWCRLHIAQPTPPFYLSTFSRALEATKVAQRLETTKTWLGRSGHCPLSLSVASLADDNQDPETGSVIHPTTRLILRALIPFAARWQDIKLTVSSSVLDTLFGLTDHDVPILKKLEIIQHPEQPLHHVRWELFGLLHGPNISSFNLHGISENYLAFPIQWDHLTTLSIVGDGWPGPSLMSSVAVEILSKCSRVQTCRFVLNDAPINDDEEDVSGVEQPSLHSLHLADVASAIRYLLRRISFPALHHFGFVAFHGDMESVTNNMFAPLLATSTRLESLRIPLDSFAKSTLIDLLHALPFSLKQLRLNGRSDPWAEPFSPVLDDETLAALTPSASNPSVACPSLRELSITNCTRALSDAALLRFIQARMAVQPSASLKRVEIQFNREMEEDIQGDIQPFLDAGLEVSTTYKRREVWHYSPWQGLDDAPEGPLFG